MNALATGWGTEQTAGTADQELDHPLYAVVGFDGSKPAFRALDGAARLLHDRAGGLEVVYVAHVPATAVSAGMAAEVVSGFGDATGELAGEVRQHLDGSEPRWHFQRRDGLIADQLLAAADELRSQHGPDAAIVLVVGRSAQKFHHLVGSVAHSLERHDRFPVVVVP